MTHQTADDTTVQDFDPSLHLKQLRHLGELGNAWERDLSSSNARVLTVHSEAGTINGAALLTARSVGSYVKISGILASDAATRTKVLDEVLSYAQRQELACVKWELWAENSELTALAMNTGFRRLPTPRRATDSANTSPVAGYVYWLHPAQYLQTPHYQQSESFTCAAVAALTAHEETTSIQGLDQLRIAELLLWRQATNFMACDPVELGLSIADRWPSGTVSVCLDTNKPVMLDCYPEAEHDWRGILQAQSRLRAESTGLPVTTKRLQVAEIDDLIAHGARVLLLVSLQKMLGFDVPHWVLCHGTAGSAHNRVLVLEDSWVNESSAESWVDATCLPLPIQEVDLMSSLETDGYRAAVVVTGVSARN